MEILGKFVSTIIDGYGVAGVALVAIVVLLFVVQVVQLSRLFIVARFKQTSRPQLRQVPPPVSVVVPLFGEDEEYLKEDLRVLLSQSCQNYEVVVVYVGKEDAFYATLKHMRKFFHHLKTTQIDYTPQYPITMKLALNIGIKSATYEHIVFTTPESCPATRNWVEYMSNGFKYGDIVLGYCNWERKSGLKNLFYRKYRLSEVRTYLAEAIRGHQYGASRNSMGFTKELYFSVRGFDHLNLTAGEDDLFVQSIATKDNVSVLLAPAAHCAERQPASFRMWLLDVYRQGQTRRFYTQRARNAESCELLCRVAFFTAAIGAMVALPLELKLFAFLLVVVRYIVMGAMNQKTAARVGERKIAAWEPLFDFFEPWVRFAIRATQPKQVYKWR
jgi:cellulose synthase/poly-beta-1,6-N-acetylglucosamine synthase-like glycosyltransferase